MFLILVRTFEIRSSARRSAARRPHSIESVSNMDHGLTVREIEYLRWTYKGKTAWETAAILGTSESTAAKMIRSATAKLGALNKTLAAIKAHEMGLFGPEDNSEQAGKRDDAGIRALALATDEILGIDFTDLRTTVLPLPDKPHVGPITGYGESRLTTAARDVPVFIGWHWVENRGIVVMEDPLSIRSNLRITGSGQHQDNLVLHLLGHVHKFDWQRYVLEVLKNGVETHDVHLPALVQRERGRPRLK